MWQEEVGPNAGLKSKSSELKKKVTRNYKVEGEKRTFTTLILQANHDTQGRTQQMGTMRQQARED